MNTKPKSSTTRNILIAVAIGVVGICGCLACAVLLIPSQGTSTPTQEAISANLTDAPSEPAAGPTEPPPPTDTPEPTPTPTLPPTGQTRDNPAPLGVAVDIGGDRVLTVVHVTRPANEIVASANQFNPQPETGQEYIQVELQVTCNKPTNDTCSFLTYEIKAVGADGNVKDPALIAGVEGELESGEFFGGAVKSGKVFYLIAEGDSNVVLFYEPFFGDPIYLAIQ